jgi:acyl carrier protein
VKVEAQRTIQADELSELFPVVAEIVADALARDAAEVRLDSRLIEDLGAESIDFLDIVFRLEQAFKVEIPRGQILEDARGPLSEQELEENGRLTDAGVERLRQILSEVPATRFRPVMRVGDIPALFTVETFCKLVARARGTSG